MTIKAENTLNEIQSAGGYYSAKPIETSATGTFGAVVNSGAQAVAGALTVGGALTVTGISTLGATGQANYTSFGPGGPRLISGTLAPPANPTGITAPLGTLFINLGATGVTNRVYINTDGATGWTFLATSGV